jgi:hypothetical protein
MRDRLSTAARRFAPQVMADREHRYQHALHEQWGLDAIAGRLTAEHGDRVLRGPFAGLRYPPRRIASVPKRIGAYELELHPWLDAALALPPARFVDIGAADGFYAVGVARRGIPTEAFEIARSARAEIRALAQLNRVELTVRGRATAALLERLDFRDALVLCDCEGAEVDLLVPPVVARLATATVIVEVHESSRPGAGALLRERFAATHAIDVIEPAERDAAAFPELAALDPATGRIAITEGRTGATPWYRMSPRPVGGARDSV